MEITAQIIVKSRVDPIKIFNECFTIDFRLGKYLFVKILLLKLKLNVLDIMFATITAIGICFSIVNINANIQIFNILLAAALVMYSATLRSNRFEIHFRKIGNFMTFILFPNFK
jgi:hypothetical protein